MDAEERDICLYLKSMPDQFVSVREINRRAGGKRRFQENPEWAQPILVRLLEKGLIETDSTHHYRLRRKAEKPRGKWVSPQMRSILEKSSKDFSQVFQIDDPDEAIE